MRLYGFLTVSAVLINSILSSFALALALATSSEVQTNLLPPNYQYGRQASPDTSGSSSSEATAEYAGSESSEEACDCDQKHSSILEEPNMPSPAYTIPSYSLIASSIIASTATIPASTSPVRQPPVSGTLQPQQITPSLAPAPTYIGPPAIAPSLVPPTISPPASLPTIPVQAGGQEWYQVTYWECVTWPSDYVHCGWHTPLRKGKNPDPNGETFVYGAGSNLKARVWWMGMFAAGVALATL